MTTGQHVVVARWCKHCSRVAEFTRPNAPRCRECAVAKVQKWRAENPEKYRAAYARNNADKERRRAGLIMSRYGITVADYERMYLEQAGTCKVCATAATVLDIDHDHGTGHVRGLLCRSCNLAVGLLADDPQRVRALADYLTGASA